MAFLHRITLDPATCQGAPVIQGTNYPVSLIVDLLRSGITPSELLTDCPALTREDLIAALLYTTHATTRSGSSHCGDLSDFSR
ncbi:DUF433 domain-containing protein [Nocardia sp. CDC160]|uniref:DUF433 domain-containing protein n=1 Tax=Nocardia sp. CDC160 TaxID=3112166 RepID=UPI002DB6AA65|nr:DUF433 domain-containing protein [Nocardia sp. CDC160]MEC3913695.1 DUF433 domain-containing protein [Nocardia sp. CDC160]